MYQHTHTCKRHAGFCVGQRAKGDSPARLHGASIGRLYLAEAATLRRPPESVILARRALPINSSIFYLLSSLTRSGQRLASEAGFRRASSSRSEKRTKRRRRATSLVSRLKFVRARALSVIGAQALLRVMSRASREALSRAAGQAAPRCSARPAMLAFHAPLLALGAKLHAAHRCTHNEA